MKRFVILGSLLATALFAWLIVLSPTWTEYTDARDAKEVNAETLEVVKNSGFRVEEKDERGLNKASGSDWVSPLTGTSFSPITDDTSLLKAIGDGSSLEPTLNILLGGTIATHEVYDVMVFPSVVAPIVKVNTVEVVYLPSGSVNLIIKGGDKSSNEKTTVVEGL